jgi:hypothetical protein
MPVLDIREVKYMEHDKRTRKTRLAEVNQRLHNTGLKCLSRQLCATYWSD